MKSASLPAFGNGSLPELLLHRRWPWHLLFWIGYALFRSWLYYITVTHYPPIFLRYMLISEVMLVSLSYVTLWGYRRLFASGRYLAYFATGVGCWVLFLVGRTLFQFSYLQGEPGFRGNSFSDIIFNNLAFVVAFFLFLTTCKYFKDGYIAQHLEAEKREQQLVAEVNNLKSQIAPHFLFNTLNNLYGLSVEKSDKLPDLMLRLSDLLRHSLYEGQKPLVPLAEELGLLNSYVQLERVRMEEDLQLDFENRIAPDAPYMIAPLLLIVFVENAFKHARLVRSGAVCISIRAIMEGDWFCLTVRNNYDGGKEEGSQGIGLKNVIRRLEVLYPNRQHTLTIIREEEVFSVYLHVQLTRTFNPSAA